MLRRIWLFLSLSLLSASAVLAQTSGQISGHVSDTSGAAIPKVAVTLTSAATGVARSTFTTSAGDYAFPDVQPGNYSLQATHPDFKTDTAQLELQVQQSLRQDFTLQVGQVTQSVTVEATAALLQADNPTLGTVVPTQTLSQMPLNSRNYLSLVAVSANTNTLSTYQARPIRGRAASAPQESISVGGQRIMYDHYTIDGINNTDVDFNSFVVQPTVDAIQEMKVQTGVYPAQYGYNATQVNVVTKSGGNAYHGTAFYFLRNNYADARGFNYTPSLSLPSCPSDITITDSCSAVRSRFPSSSTPKTAFSSWSIRSGFPRARAFRTTRPCPQRPSWAAISPGSNSSRAVPSSRSMIPRQGTPMARAGRSSRAM